ncbi:MAG: cell division protein ZapA [Bdellovibrionales bacterium]
MNIETNHNRDPQTPMNSFEVQIAGYTMKLRSNHTQDVVEELARFVDGRFRRFIGTKKTAVVDQASILTALSIAEDLYNLKQDTKTSLDQISRKTNRLITDLSTSEIES